MRFVGRGDVEHDIRIGMRAKAPSVGASTIAANGDTTDVRGRPDARAVRQSGQARTATFPKNLAIAT